MRHYLVPVLAVVLLATSGCVAALVGAAGAGAGYAYSHAKKNQAPSRQGVTAQPANGASPAKGVTAQPASGASPPEGTQILPGPGELVDCRLKDGVNYAMSADDCKAQGGTTS